MTVCIIPARKSSKRIKNKNIINFYNKPIIYYAIKLAIRSKLFSRIIVSTDSIKIANLAKKYGAEVPFIRNKKLADDFTSTNDVMRDAINKINLKDNFLFCIYPTSVLISPKHLRLALKKIKKTKSDICIPVKKFSNSPLRGYYQNGNFLKLFNKRFYNSRSQDLKNFYYDSGSFYVYNTRSLLLEKKTISKITFIELDYFSGLDINTYEDFQLAKLMYKLKK